MRESPTSNCVDLYIHITDICNMSCKHCYLGEDGLNNSKRSFDSIKNSIDYATREINLNSVVLLGGEPFTHPDILDIAEYVATKNVPLKIITNGFMIEDKVENIKNIVSEVRVSIDGFENEHDFLRKKNSYSEALKCISKCVEKNIPVSITLVVNQMNYSYLDRFASFFSGHGVEYIKLHNLRLVGNAINNDFLNEVDINKVKENIIKLDNIKLDIPIYIEEVLMPDTLKEKYPLEDSIDRVELLMDNSLHFSCYTIGVEEKKMSYLSKEFKMEVSNFSNNTRYYKMKTIR